MDRFQAEARTLGLQDAKALPHLKDSRAELPCLHCGAECSGWPWRECPECSLPWAVLQGEILDDPFGEIVGKAYLDIDYR